MFEKIGRMAEMMTTKVSLSRRDFFSRLAAVAGAAVLGVMAVLPTAAHERNNQYACYCRKRGVLYCACLASDPNVSYCCSNCAALCSRV